MAGYLPGSNVRSDTAQPLHLANAAYGAYNDSGNAGSLMFAHPSVHTPQGKSTNSQQGHDYYYGYQSAHALAQGSLEHQPIAALYNPNTGQQYPPGRLTNQMGNSPYNWAAVNELSFLPSTEEPQVAVAARLSSVDLSQLPKPEFTHFTMKHQSPHNEQGSFFQNAFARGLNMDVSQATRGQTRGLSLSLSPQRPGQIQYYNMQPEESGGGNLNDSGFPGTRSPLYMSDRHVQMEPNVMSILRPGGFLSSSKYRKAAQQLLDEVVSVKGAVKSSSVNKSKPQSHMPQISVVNASTAKDYTRADVNFPAANAMPHAPSTSGIAPSSEPQTSTAPELTPEERQEFQLKQVKLMAMLNEVDKRYKLYYSQMQTVVRAFESEAGIGAAQSYTALALQTISRHFRCLRDAIVSQLREAQRRLGEEAPASPGSGTTKLRFVDQQLRQHRALHQLQMMQQHTWRPQRGLPERSVSILRAWLFEHFLHPYPKDADKLMLAKQTGLTRNQVSNWFINARVRLWKPMVEEMYQEETKEAELSANQSSYSGDEEVNPQKDSIEWIEACGSTEPEKKIVLQQQQQSHFDGTQSASEVTTTVDTQLYPDPKKARSSVESSRLGVLAETAMFSAMHDKKDEGNRSSLEQDNRHRFMMMREMERGFESYQPGLMRYGTAAMNVTPVSLTLGLQHCDNIEAPHPGPQQYLQAQQPSHSLSYGALPVPSHQIVGGYTNAESLESLAQFHNHKQYPLHDFVG